MKSTKEFNISPFAGKTKSYKRQEFVWSQESLCLSDVCRRFGLPQVIQYDRCESLARIVNFDLTQPLMAYSARAVRKVCASGVVEEECVGEPIIIPEDYKGWFSVLKPGCISPYYTAINSIAQSNVTSFLVTSRLPGFQVVRETGKYIPRFILPGEVLQVSRTYIGTKKVKEKSLFKKRKTVEVRYLMCLDANDRELLFSMDQKGSFYAVTVSHEAQSQCCVLRMCDILQKLHFPVNVRLVFGRKPMSASTLPSDLRLNASFMDDSVVALTMAEEHNIFLELPKSNSPLRFKVAMKTPLLTKSAAFAKAVTMCEDGVDTYMRDIKVSLTSAVNDQHYYDSLQHSEPMARAQFSGVVKGASTPSLVHGSCTKLDKSRNTSFPDIRKSFPSPLRKKSPKKLTSKDRCTSLDNDTVHSTKLNPKDYKKLGADYECLWKPEKPPVIKRRNNSNNSNTSPFSESASMDSIRDRTLCRLSFEGTYIVLPDYFTMTNNAAAVNIPRQKDMKTKLTITNSLETVSDINRRKPRDYVNLDPLTKSSSESDLLAYFANPVDRDFKNSTDLRHNIVRDEPSSASAKSTNGEFYATLKRVRPVEQALRVSVYGDIEGWDVVDHRSSQDTYLSHDSGYISMNDVNGGRSSRDLSDPATDVIVEHGAAASNLPDISIVPSTDPNKRDSTYIAMNDLRDDYNNVRVQQDTEQVSDMDGGDRKSLDSGVTTSPERSVVGGIGSKSVGEVGELLRCCGIREDIVKQFMDEKVDGQLLLSLDLSIIRETFPDLRAIEAKKVWMMGDILVGTVENVTSQRRYKVKVRDREVLVLYHNDAYFALDLNCFHEGRSLYSGTVADIEGHPCIKCPEHKKLIDISTGNLIRPKYVAGEPCGYADSGKRQRTHRVYSQDGNVYLTPDFSKTQKLASDDHNPEPK